MSTATETRTYYISTDSASETISAPTADAAANEFARGEGAPAWVWTVATLERWLEKTGGYGCMRCETTGETLFDIPS